MRLPRFAKFVLSVFAVAAIAGISASDSFYKAGIAGMFYPWVFASVLLIHLRLKFRWMDVAGILFLGIVLAFFDFKILHYGLYVIAWVSFFGMGSLLIMAFRAIWSEGEERNVILLALVPGVLLLASNCLAGYFHLWTERLHPKVLDLYLYSFDSSLHVPIAFFMGQTFAKWKIFRAVSMVFYMGLPITLALVYAGQAIRLRAKAVPIFAAFLFAGPIGALFFNLFPALGPIHLFLDRFPAQPFTPEQARRVFVEPLEISGLRNAIPSLHMGWTLLAWWYSRGLSLWERSIAFAFVAFTVCATLGTGEHYFIDLVVAFPFVLCLQALCTVSLDWSDSRRLVPFLFGFIVTLSWLVVLRFGLAVFWYSSLIPWVSSLATVGGTACVRHGLKDAAVGNIGSGRAMFSTITAAATEPAHYIRIR
jgi:hypothetical protein